MKKLAVGRKKKTLPLQRLMKSKQHYFAFITFVLFWFCLYYRYFQSDCLKRRKKDWRFKKHVFQVCWSIDNKLIVERVLGKFPPENSPLGKYPPKEIPPLGKSSTPENCLEEKSSPIGEFPPLLIIIHYVFQDLLLSTSLMIFSFSCLYMLSCNIDTRGH